MKNKWYMVIWFLGFAGLASGIAFFDNSNRSATGFFLMMEGLYLAGGAYWALRYNLTGKLFFRILLHFLFWLTLLGSTMMIFALFLNWHMAKTG